MRKLFFCLFAGIISPVLAQTPVQDLFRKSGDAASYATSDQLVIFDSTITDMQETGLTYVVNHTLTKALTSHGALEMNVVKFGYDPQSAFVEIRKVVI